MFDMDCQKVNQSFAKIYTNYLPRIRRYILSNSGSEEDVNDIFQETMYILYNQVLFGKVQLEGTIGNFIYKIASNLYINQIIKYKNISLMADLPDLCDESVNFVEKMEEEEKWNFFNQILDEYDDDNRQFLLLSLSENISMKEVAKKTGLANENVAKSKAYRCRKQVIELAKDKGMYKQLK